MRIFEVQTELRNLEDYFKYLLKTTTNLLDEMPNNSIYQAAWLSKCLNLQEILTIFQNQIVNKREKFNLVLDQAIKELDNDVDTKIQTTSLEKIAINDETRDTIMINHISAISNGLAMVRSDFEKKFETFQSFIITHGNELHEIKTCVFPTMLKMIQELKAELTPIKEQKAVKIESTTVDKKIPKWTIHIEEVKQKMKEKGWSEHEVSELAKINFNSFRKFQKKDPKLTKLVVDKILKLFDIAY